MKNKIHKSKNSKDYVKNRVWINIIFGCYILLTQMYASFIFYQNNLFGLPQILTLGSIAPTAITIANNIYILINSRKL